MKAFSTYNCIIYPKSCQCALLKNILSGKSTIKCLIFKLNRRPRVHVFNSEDPVDLQVAGSEMHQ